MAKITKSVIINAPVEKVFEYISNPANLMEWHPNSLGVRDITGRGENQRWTSDYKLMGITFTSKAQVIRSVLNTERVVKSTGGVESTRVFRFKREAGGTRLDYELEYTIPTPVIGKVGELLVLQRSERVVDMAMANIREMMERQTSSGD